jgi:Protein of unknown function (DUF3011)
MKRSRALVLAASLVLLGVPLVASAVRLSCESRDYRRSYCATGGTIASARLVTQTSRSACVQGRTWGFDSNGIWVTQGCSGEFDFKWAHEPRPVPGRQIACASQNFQQSFCRSDRRITRAWLVEQRSQSACVQGRSWGFQDTGIWVSSGCNGLFGIEGRGPPPGPPPLERVSCESRGYQQAFCPTRASVARAWLLEQRSEAACIQGDTWGFQRNGIWVDRGCSALFAYEQR